MELPIIAAREVEETLAQILQTLRTLPEFHKLCNKAGRPISKLSSGSCIRANHISLFRGLVVVPGALPVQNGHWAAKVINFAHEKCKRARDAGDATSFKTRSHTNDQYGGAICFEVDGVKYDIAISALEEEADSATACTHGRLKFGMTDAGLLAILREEPDNPVMIPLLKKYGLISDELIRQI